jgi:hypothetical protein
MQAAVAGFFRGWGNFQVFAQARCQGDAGVQRIPPKSTIRLTFCENTHTNFLYKVCFGTNIFSVKMVKIDTQSPLLGG